MANNKDRYIAVAYKLYTVNGDQVELIEEAPADITSDALLDRILLDKQREFVGEGVNFFDLKRTHLQPLARLSRWGSASNANISVDDYRWTFPIPRSEYRFNDNVSQNEGWPINK